MGNRLDRVGFKLTSFTEKYFVEEFQDCYHLMDYLSSSGMSFAGKDSRQGVLKDLFLAAASIYQAKYAQNYEPSENELESSLNS